jgi:quinol monooxygenase YgiN
MSNLRRSLAWVAAAAAISPLAAQQTPAARLYVVTYVDVYPQYAAEAAKMLEQLSADSRKEAGSVRFEAMRDVARANHFAIVEVWQSRQAYETHRMAGHTRSFRERLQAWLGSPFDERLYSLLE